MKVPKRQTDLVTIHSLLTCVADVKTQRGREDYAFGSSDMLFAEQMSGLFTLDTYVSMHVYLDMSFTSAVAGY